MLYRERGTDRAHAVVFVGDGNNVVSSLMEASTLLGFALTVVSPPEMRAAGAASGWP